MATNTQKINAKSVLKYTLLPGIIPRARALGSSGFGYLAFLFACVYRAVRILPANHPYVNPANIGKFGLMKVIIAAANNLKISLRNIDQLVVFVALLSALVLMVLQFVLLIAALFSGQAFAQTAPFTSMFLTAAPATDIAFLLLDYVFGIPGPSGGAWFGSNALNGGGGIPAGPTPFHIGLHALFNFYNLAILLVGVLIFLYYVVVVVIETAQTGIPFGRRFSKLYAPFRLVIAIGLLVPLNYGFNGAQYITLYAAKLGSSFATNGWILYNTALLNPTGFDNPQLVARPRTPDVAELWYFGSVYNACVDSYNILVAKNDRITASGGTCIQAYVIVDGTAELFAPSNNTACGNNLGETTYGYDEAKTKFGKGTMEIVLGELDTSVHTTFPGSVKPFCGKMTVSLGNDNPPFYTGPASGGVRDVESLYFQMAKYVLYPLSSFAYLGQRVTRSYVPLSTGVRNICYRNGVDELNDPGTCTDRGSLALANSFIPKLNEERVATNLRLQTAYRDFAANLDLTVNPEMQNRGWGGAGIWYNHIADMNGSMTSATYATPMITQYPLIMEEVKKQRLAQNKAGDVCEMYEPNLADGKEIDLMGHENDVAKILNQSYRFFACQKPTQQAEETAPPATPGPAAPCPDPMASVPLSSGGVAKGNTKNLIIDTMSMIFGINGLFDLRTASCWDNATGRPSVHPLAQLSTLGKALVENAIRSMGLAILGSLVGGEIGNSASGMFVGIATIGLTMGFILFYILPFLPFMYFFFAVGAWVKSIFEAMVGVPLWALAHLHIDGDGLSGGAAKGGYFLLLEIFLRPIVTVFGLIAGMAAFTAMAGMLNNIFDLVVFNISGAVPGASTATVNGGAVDSFRRGVIDEFFYTIMYAILLYMMATACFKMIDTIPSSIMRWIGSGVSTFNDSKEDPTSGLTQYAALGGSQISGQLLQGVRQGAQGLSSAGKGLFSEMTGGNEPKTGP